MENQSNNKIFTYLLAVFFAVFVGSGIFLMMSNRQNSNNSQPASTSTIQQQNLLIPTAVPKRGEIKLLLGKDEEPVSLATNPNLKLGLTVDSDGENVTAFDVIVGYDSKSFDFISANSLDSNFKIYSYPGDKSLTLTIVKTGESVSIFTGETIGQLVFQPKVKGSFDFAVLSASGKETTKFVNDKTEVIYPSLNEIKVAVN